MVSPASGWMFPPFEPFVFRLSYRSALSVAPEILWESRAFFVAEALIAATPTPSHGGASPCLSMLR